MIDKQSIVIIILSGPCSWKPFFRSHLSFIEPIHATLYLPMRCYLPKP